MATTPPPSGWCAAGSRTRQARIFLRSRNPTLMWIDQPMTFEAESTARTLSARHFGSVFTAGCISPMTASGGQARGSIRTNCLFVKPLREMRELVEMLRHLCA